MDDSVRREQENLQTIGNLTQAAKLAVDVGRLLAGDASAVKDILTNKCFWGILIAFSLIIAMIGMIVGGSITGVIEYIFENWERIWDEKWTEQAIASGGDAHYLQTTGLWNTLKGTAEQVVKEAFASLITGGIAEGFGTSDNQQLSDEELLAAGRNPNETDYETTMQSIVDSVKLDKALTDRLDMIKGRVLQRGKQLQGVARNTLGTGAIAQMNLMAKNLTKYMVREYENNEQVMVLYAGYDEQLSKAMIEIDISVFQLTDLQAIKILAMFAIQYDCQLTDMDIWSLMDYCGWYNSEASPKELEDFADSIYDGMTTIKSFGSTVEGITQEELAVMLTSMEMPPYKVPKWTGECAPQWYFEEIKQIHDMNEKYRLALQNGRPTDGMTSVGMECNYTLSGDYVTVQNDIIEGSDTNEFYYYTYVVQDANGTAVKERNNVSIGKNIVFEDLEPYTEYTVRRRHYHKTFYVDSSTWSQPELLEDIELVKFTPEPTFNLDADQLYIHRLVEPFSIIDKLYYSAENNITINRNVRDEDLTREELESIIKWNVLGNDASYEYQHIYSYFEDYVWALSKNTANGTVIRNDYGAHLYRYKYDIPADKTLTISKETFTIVNTSTYRLELYKVVEDADGSPSTEMTPLPENLVAVLTSDSEVLAFTDLESQTRYAIYLVQETLHSEYTKDGLLMKQETACFYTKEDTFTTFEDKQKALVYELYMTVNISFKARTIDDIAFEVLGIWPGNLEDTTQVVRTTRENNLVGKTKKDEYSYCLYGGTYKLIAKSSNAAAISDGYYAELKRPYTTKDTFSIPYTVTRWAYEYGLSTKYITSLTQTPESGWKTVSVDGQSLVFDNISGSKNYYVYARLTKVEEVLDQYGNITQTTSRYLFVIDRIQVTQGADGALPDFREENGAIYANGHLGNPNMKQAWTDLYEDAEGNLSDVLYFNRQAGYQYETYIDIVMALCELLEVSYEDWEPALKRAEELNLAKAQS